MQKKTNPRQGGELEKKTSFIDLVLLPSATSDLHNRPNPITHLCLVTLTFQDGYLAAGSGKEELEQIIMGLAYNVYLTSNKIFGCKQCKTHLADYDDIISRVGALPPYPTKQKTCTDWKTVPQNFRGQHGKAYLFNNVVNITQSEAVERSMTTGRHIVRDIACRQCRETVGWKYDKAYETSEKYKEGKFILEEELLCVVC